MGEACLHNGYTSTEMQASSISDCEHSHFPWYALKVRTGGEANVVLHLESRGFAPYCPTQKVRKRYSDRIRVVDAPVFPGYMFCRFDAQKKLPIISVPGVDRILGFSNVPAPIPEQELQGVRRLIECGGSAIRTLVRGQRVRVTRGLLEGVEGVLVRDQEANQLVVSIGLLEQGACLHIEDEAVCPID